MRPASAEPLPKRYDTPSFVSEEDANAKMKIGDLVASFISEEPVKDKSVFLGSGSTIFHVGLRMWEYGRHYEQQFWTVNIALAAAWCERFDPALRTPVTQISIPEAVLETHTFRFATMRPPRWSPAIAIVSADGCFFKEKEGVVLYGNAEAVAQNTNLFVENATHSVLCCLSSEKIQKGFAEIPNAGPPIFPPTRRSVVRVLVTNEPPHEVAARAFRAGGWLIVAAQNDWTEVRKIIEARQSSTLSSVEAGNVERS